MKLHKSRTVGGSGEWVAVETRLTKQVSFLPSASLNHQLCAPWFSYLPGIVIGGQRCWQVLCVGDRDDMHRLTQILLFCHFCRWFGSQ